MYVLVAERPTALSRVGQPLPIPGGFPASMVWVDPEDLADDAAVEPLYHRSAIPRGLRVFGPFETYEEGELAAAALAAEGDYWVIPLDSVTTEEQEQPEQ